MRSFNKYIVLIFFILALYSFFIKQNEEGYLGKLKINGIENIYFKIYQEREFDSVVGIDFEIVNEEDSIISRRRFLTGTHNYETNLNNFTANSIEGIVYLCYLDSNEVDVLYDLKTGKGLRENHHIDYNDFVKEREKLFQILFTHDSTLTANWHR